MPNQIVALHTIGNRIYAADIQESVHVLRYKAMENQIVVFADDTSPRFTVASCLLDYSTACVSDKFGNIAIVRVRDDEMSFSRFVLSVARSFRCERRCRNRSNGQQRIVGSRFTERRLEQSNKKKHSKNFSYFDANPSLPFSVNS